MGNATSRPVGALVVVCLAAGVAASPATASAQSFNLQINPFDSDEFREVATASLVVAPSLLTFATADIAYAAQGRWLPPAWAWSQLLVGGTLTAIGGGVLVQSDDDGMAAAGTATLVIAGWFVTHAVLSLTLRPRPGRARTRQAACAGLRLVHAAHDSL